VAACVASVEVVERRTGDPENPVEYVHKVKLWDKNTALANLAKHFGLLKDLVEGKVTVDFDPLWEFVPTDRLEIVLAWMKEAEAARLKYEGKEP
jgi:hypothetical protein